MYSLPQDDKIVYIYILIDTRIQTPFYVGKTIDPNFRLSQHIVHGQSYIKHNRTTGNKKALVIKDMLLSGFAPTMQVIEKTTLRYSHNRECLWLEGFQDRGYVMANGENTLKYPREIRIRETREDSLTPDEELFLAVIRNPKMKRLLIGIYNQGIEDGLSAGQFEE